MLAIAVLYSACSCSSGISESDPGVTVIEYAGVYTITCMFGTIASFLLAFFSWGLSSPERKELRRAATALVAIGILLLAWIQFGKYEAVVVTPKGLSMRYGNARIEFSDVDSVEVCLSTTGSPRYSSSDYKTSEWEFRLTPAGIDRWGRGIVRYRFFVNRWPAGEDRLIETLREHGVKVKDWRRE